MSGNFRIMCFGDSLTWGWIPTVEGPPTQRYQLEQRWPGAMLSALGEGYEIVEEGLNARTTELDDPVDPRLNGAAYLPSALASHMPLDLVIVMLGTNDTKRIFNRSAFEITHGISRLIGMISNCGGGVGTCYGAPRPMLLAPPVIGNLTHPWQEAKFEGARQKTQEMAKLYAAFADYAGIDFLDAGGVISTDGCDGIHLTAQNNIDLGRAIAEKVRLL